MKTVEKKYFVCEICGRTSLNEQKIADCQANHRRVTDDCQVESIFNKGAIFPREINITWPDGALADYILNFTEKAPETKKEGE